MGPKSSTKGHRSRPPVVFKSGLPAGLCHDEFLLQLIAIYNSNTQFCLAPSIAIANAVALQLNIAVPRWTYRLSHGGMHTVLANHVTQGEY